MSAFLLSECVENSNVSLFVKTSHTLWGGWGGLCFVSASIYSGLQAHMLHLSFGLPL